MGAPIGNQNAKNGARIKSYARQLVEADPTLLPRMLMAMANKACDGDVQAFNAFCDRFDGKVAQAIVGDDAEPPVTLQGFIKLVRPSVEGG